MNWQHVFFSAAVALVAASVLALMRKKQWIGKTTGVVIFVAVIIGWNVIDTAYLMPNKSRSLELQYAEASMAKLPIFQTIKQYAPDTYQTLKEKVVDAKAEGKDLQQAIDLVQADSSAFLLSRLYSAPDDKVITTLKVMLEQGENIQQQSDEACFKFFFPFVSGGVNPLTLNSTELIQRRMRADSELVAASYTSPRAADKPREDAAAAQAIQPVIQRLYGQYGADLQMIADPAAKQVDRKKVCDITLQLYRHILALPPQQAAAVIRSVLTN
ncbi:hypothetical protein [Candidatus Symbiopectobacterium sp. NZEC135]|uniref:hypothetical protein n=1 Tax=Candidatus Symbiopectobacterium sp. NZEC135 TaxID=2820471 RepID=UPI002227BB9B|nr:hypothetical protein [Candidatus Symbiopectobacterium sp. NZEC135]MCW2481082.1 hypothetical protein [Candidatus Symbiopectobacterium sp. NZEC135]